jgi:hypothetical protein
MSGRRQRPTFCRKHVTGDSLSLAWVFVQHPIILGRAPTCTRLEPTPQTVGGRRSLTQPQNNDFSFEQ